MSAEEGWKYELLERYGGTVLVFYLNEDTRGSVMLYSPEEIEAWKKAILTLNSDDKSQSETKR